jgi:hypothetical protein
MSEHIQYREEVEQRWGKAAYADGDSWWRGLSADEKADFKRRQDTLLADWRAAAEAGIDPASDEAQALAARQEAWLGSIPGTPGFGTGKVPVQHLLGLTEMYVADERFAANYGGKTGAEFVRDTLKIFVDRSTK